MATTPPVVLEPKTQAFVDALAAQGGPPIYTLSPADARNVLEKAQSGTVRKEPAEIEDRALPGGPAGDVSVRIFRPTGAKGPLPVVMYFHGGGWILGSKDTHDRLLRELTNGANAAFVFVNYTPSPEAHYPVPIEQAYAATKYIAEHGTEMDLDPTRLAVAGDSVGGNMTAAVTLLAKERGGPNIRYQVMLYPVTDAAMDTGSYNQFANGPWLTKAAMAWFWDAYAPDKASRNQPTASPLRASAEQLRGLPPALLVTDENDVLRDEGEAYARRLIEAGVDTTAVRFLATIHDFAMLNGLADTQATRSVIDLTASKLFTALSRGSAPSQAGAA